jgi:hypothetical protein
MQAWWALEAAFLSLPGIGYPEYASHKQTHRIRLACIVAHICYFVMAMAGSAEAWCP